MFIWIWFSILFLYRPVPGRWLSQGQSQHRRSKSTPEVKVNTGRRLGEETLSASAVKKEGVAKARRRLDEAVAQPGGRQIKHYQSKAITVWFLDTHG